MTRLAIIDYFFGMIRVFEKKECEKHFKKEYRLFWKWWINRVEEK